MSNRSETGQGTGSVQRLNRSRTGTGDRAESMTTGVDKTEEQGRQKDKFI